MTNAHIEERKRKFPHDVELPHHVDINDALDWLADLGLVGSLDKKSPNTEAVYHVHLSPKPNELLYEFAFAEVKNAIMFKLRWGGS